jgi:hypothetical protein
MEVIYPHCRGLDVHKKNVVACVITPEEKEIRTFSTMTEPTNPTPVSFNNYYFLKDR